MPPQKIQAKKLHLVIVRRDTIVSAINGILNCVQVIQDLPRCINVRLAPFEITE